MATIAAGLLAGGRIARAEDAASVTTDTVAYCFSLADRLRDGNEMPPLARALWEDGRTLCQRGNVRAGLARLRRAMMMMHGGDHH